MKLRNLVGERFGRLVVLEHGKTERTKYGTIHFWKCKCDCGNEVEVRSAELTGGKTKSCGCLWREAISGPKVDVAGFVGKTFGKLTIKEIVSGDSLNTAIARCVCECGNEDVFKLQAVVRGNNVQCRERKNHLHFLDLLGQRFGRLTAIERCEFPNLRPKWRWRCLCDCGNEVFVSTTDLNSGHTLSCGCLRKERISESHTTHGFSKTKLYRVWKGISCRCENQNQKSFKSYGGRGIQMCETWRKSFPEFRRWALENGYEEGLSIERIDVDGDYCPENCTWISMKEQAQNKRNTVYVDVNGESVAACKIANESGSDPRLVSRRLRDGWDVDKAISTQKILREVTITAFGETRSLSDWSETSGIPTSVIRKRISELGWNPEEAVTSDVRPTVALNPPEKKFKITDIVEFDGQKVSLKDLAERHQLSRANILQRLNRGWDLETTLKTPVNKCHNDYEIQLEYNGCVKPLSDWARELKIDAQIIRDRLSSGWSTERALSEKPKSFDKLPLVTAFGETKTVKEWAKATGIDYRCLIRRLFKYNWPAERSLSEKPNECRIRKIFRKQ